MGALHQIDIFDFQVQAHDIGELTKRVRLDFGLEHLENSSSCISRMLTMSTDLHGEENGSECRTGILESFEMIRERKTKLSFGDRKEDESLVEIRLHG